MKSGKFIVQGLKVLDWPEESNIQDKPFRLRLYNKNNK